MQHLSRRGLIGTGLSAALLGRSSLPVQALAAGATAPGLADDAYDGRFYGCLAQGDSIGNTRFGKGRPVSIRFRAERSGRLRGFRWNLRYNSGINSSHHVETAYSLGAGGEVTVELRTNDPAGGPARWWPSRTVLGETLPNNGEPGPLVGRDPYPVWGFTSPVPVAKGEIYHLVFHQWHERDAVSVNLLTQWNPIPFGNPGGRNGPYYGDDWSHLWAREDGSWFHRDRTLAFVEFIYEDGAVTGVGEIYASGSTIQGIGGPAMAREHFEVTDHDRLVSGVWFRIWQETPVQDSLVLTLADDERGAIEETMVDPGLVPASDLKSAPVPWSWSPFPAPRRLERGRRYTIAFSSKGEGYRVNAIRNGGRSPFGFSSRNLWMSASAEFSPDGGSHWQGWTIGRWNPDEARDDMHLSVGFPVVG